jgi:predicted enzyme related to lactoylglutathione lyase
MPHHVAKILVVSLILAGACGGSTKPTAAPRTASPAAPVRKGLQIKLTTLYVDDQEKALRFYTEVLGFVKKDDYTNGPYRWLSVTSPADLDGTQLQLALDDDPAAKAYQQAKFKQSQPAIMFYTDDIKGDYERIKAHGAEFTAPPTDVTYATIATLNDTCGNLVQLTQLMR